MTSLDLDIVFPAGHDLSRDLARAIYAMASIPTEGAPPKDVAASLLHAARRVRRLATALEAAGEDVRKQR